MLKKIALIAAIGLSTFGCSRLGGDAPAEPVEEVPLAKVAELVQSNRATVVDANLTAIRQKIGVIPGAVLLSSSKDYALSELPAEKSTKLVFYCLSTLCKASDKAAARAARAGYSDVSVLREGIRGWKSSGQPTVRPQS